MKNRTLHFACISILFWMSHSSNAATPEINTNTIEKSQSKQKSDILKDHNISINGNTFHFDKRVIHHILKYSVNTWLLSCKRDINFSKNSGLNFLYFESLSKYK